LKEASIIYVTNSAQETARLGQDLGTHLRRGDFLALTGELGSGKTWFTKGLALGLGVHSETIVTSPSFALLNEYEGRCPLFHMDAYRIENLSEFFDAGLEEFLYEDGVVVLEWAERCAQILPEHAMNIRFEIIDEHSREIVLYGFHSRVVEILAAMQDN
jgi:tRNA threonylcarbamoyladenosine biosynthesis protein TsaE